MAPRIIWKGSPNYRAQSGVKKRHITLHWMVGTLAGTTQHFSRRDSNTATQYGVGLSEIHQYVEDDDYAFGDGSTYSNTYGISIEHEGGYIRNGKRVTPARATLDLSADLCAHLAKKHGFGKLVYGKNIFRHRDWVATQCPGDLDVNYIINRANQINGYGSTPAGPAPSPKPSLTFVRYPAAKRVRLIRDANLWNFDHTSYGEMKKVKSFKKGDEIDVVGEAQHPLGSTYLLTAYSFGSGSTPDHKQGVNKVDVVEVVPSIPKPEEPKPVPQEPGKPKLRYIRYDEPVEMRAVREAGLWDFNHTSWGEMKRIKKLPAGEKVEIVGEAVHNLGSVYLMTEYSFGDGDPALDGSMMPTHTHGFNEADLEEVVPGHDEPQPEPEPNPEPPIDLPEVPADDKDPDYSKPGVLSTVIKSVIAILTGIVAWLASQGQ